MHQLMLDHSTPLHQYIDQEAPYQEVLVRVNAPNAIEYIIFFIVYCYFMIKMKGLNLH